MLSGFSIQLDYFHRTPHHSKGIFYEREMLTNALKALVNNP